jgi:hypothetical protein
MAVVEGDSGSYGVLGTSWPVTYQDQDGNNQSVNGIGVIGVVADTGDDVQAYRDAAIDNLNVPVTAAVVGVEAYRMPPEPPESQETGILGARIFGFIAGTDPRDNTRSGVYGESDQRAVSGFGYMNGIGVYGSGHVGVQGIAAHGKDALAGSFTGAVEVTGDLTVKGQSLLDMITDLQNQVKQLQNQVKQLQDQATQSSLIGMTDQGVPCVIPNNRPTIDWPPQQGTTGSGQPYIVVNGNGFTNNKAIIRVIDNAGNDSGNPGPNAPEADLPVVLYLHQGRKYTISAGDPKQEDINDLSGYLWSVSNTIDL